MIYTLDGELHLSDVPAPLLHQLIRELLEPRFGPMFVTPKDIDETVKRLAGLLSEGINMAFSNDEYDDYSE